MSEYQYYEFQAIDRPLTEQEMRELRAYSTRARITPTSFVNDYSWGNFKGDEDARPAVHGNMPVLAAPIHPSPPDAPVVNRSWHDSAILEGNQAFF